MVRFVLAAALVCAAATADARPKRLLPLPEGASIVLELHRDASLPSAAFAPAQSETCIASHYGVGDGYGGRPTASGERMDPRAMTAAHRSLPLGSRVTVTHLASGRSVSVRINDRGPFVRGRCIDLSHGAARALGMGGTARVQVQ